MRLVKILFSYAARKSNWFVSLILREVFLCMVGLFFPQSFRLPCRGAVSNVFQPNNARRFQSQVSVNVVAGKVRLTEGPLVFGEIRGEVCKIEWKSNFFQLSAASVHLSADAWDGLQTVWSRALKVIRYLSLLAGTRLWSEKVSGVKICFLRTCVASSSRVNLGYRYGKFCEQTVWGYLLEDEDPSEKCSWK